MTCCDLDDADFAQTIVKVNDRHHLVLLAEQIFSIPYQPETTSVTTSAIDSFYAGQVYVRIMHMCSLPCVVVTITSRYVSGYLYERQNQPHLASHAWAEVFVENEWYCFDISNRYLPQKSYLCRSWST